jgi:hypothetical protein
VHDFAVTGASYLQSIYQTFDRAACDRHALAIQMAPDFVGSIHLKFGVPHQLNLRHQQLISLLACTILRRIALSRGMSDDNPMGQSARLYTLAQPQTYRGAGR